MNPTGRNKILIIAGLSILSFIVILLSIFSALGDRSPTPAPTPTPMRTTIISITPIPTTSGRPRTSPHPMRELEFAQEMAQIDRDYPWLNKLPISADSYFAYFDVRQKQFIFKFINVTDEQIPSVRQEIISRLIGLGIPVEQYTVIDKR